MNELEKYDNKTLNPLEEYDRKHGKDCTSCVNHVTRDGVSTELHFCTVSGKILLYPLYIHTNCDKWRKKYADTANKKEMV